MTKIFVLSEYVMATQNSTGYFWEKLISKIADDFGYVGVIAPEGKESRREVASKIEYFSFIAAQYDKKNLASRVWGQAKQVLHFTRLIKVNVSKGDLLITGTNPTLLLLFLPLMKRWIGFEWVLLVHDVFPENLVPAQIVKSDGYSYRILSRLFNRVYSSTSCNVVIGRDMKELLVRKIGNKHDVSVIPNWVADGDVVFVDRGSSEIINRLGWQDKVVFTFFGNIGRVQGIDTILESIASVEDPRAAFLFIGEGAAVNKVERFIDSHPGDNVRYIGGLGQSQKSQGLAACDVALVTLAEGMLGLGVPSKAYFTMAANRPILAVMDKKAEVSRMVDESGIGWICEPADPFGLAKMIDWICLEGLETMRVKPREVLVESYSEHAALDKFMRCIKRTIKANV